MKNNQREQKLQEGTVNRLQSDPSGSEHHTDTIIINSIFSLRDY